MHALEVCAEIPGSTEILERMERLAALWASQGDGPVRPDPLRAGHAASDDELEEYAGRGPDGVPTGLGRCDDCGEWTGWCLDPAPESGPAVVPVYCRCLNATCCAGVRS